MSRKRVSDGTVKKDIEGVDSNITETPELPFKDPNFKHSNIVGNKKRPWKTLKQILASEQNLNWPENSIRYTSISAPPSFKPSKKYCDLSGLEALYTDPQSKLNYECSEEFAEIRKLPSDIIEGYLQLRKANTQLQ